MSWKSLQAALWPPSAKALRQGVGQQGKVEKVEKGERVVDWVHNED